MLVSGCTGGRPGDSPDGAFEIDLILSTADGLRDGDPVLRDRETVGRIVRLAPKVNRVEATARFDGSYRPTRSARFALRWDEEGRRFVQIVETRPAPDRYRSGEKVLAQVSPESLENRLWVVK
ncbi:MAG: hypothetical protein A3G34_01015 [Candidatus Lindowbacteria bacterium RIFCSPLOWO2_12_FULL_62_27]|nr:MAG: hypothetical protein A3G34_01015 [Candidatus Lindowbacteria bacterium RIFCSPLOWO2_12_FULL_62_27]OGH58262.1 MAG: hypothetical protein A3I06_01230 [Candidatus Lindowbacteria bacterium RIFCSPLOWO2_02_FULL_62_12]